jgi:RNA polymerase sigma-70 factor (ECF subfamily)
MRGRVGKLLVKVASGAVVGEEFCAPMAVHRDEDELDLKLKKLKRQVTELFDELRVPVYRYLLCLGVHAPQAEEIVQETFLRLFRHLHAGGHDENVRGWVFRVAHNISVNELKKRKYTAETTAEFWRAIAEERGDPSPGPEEILLRKERMLRVKAALSLLSEQQKQCIFLRAEGLRYREISEILGVAMSTVTESLYRAIRRLTTKPL